MHKWESEWYNTLGVYVCKNCGLIPEECKGYVTLRGKNNE